MNRRTITWRAIAISTALVSALLTCAVRSIAAEPDSDSDKAFLIKEETKEPKAVVKVRKEAKNGEEIVVVGRIGGRVNPWVKGAAAFSIVDEAVRSCDQIEGDNCPTPWD